MIFGSSERLSYHQKQQQKRRREKKTAAEADGLQLFAHLQILWDAVTRIAGYLVSSQIHRQIHCRYPWLQR